MDKIPTAEEFSKAFTTGRSEETTGEYISSMLIEFTKLHVQVCKNEIVKNIRNYVFIEGEKGEEYLDFDEELFAEEFYSLKNIK
jgi:hypothetical protein